MISPGPPHLKYQGAFNCQWALYYTAQARRDAKRIGSANLRRNVKKMLTISEQAPFASPPRYEKLLGDLTGAYSRRINIQHRLVYQVLEQEHAVKILRMWSHYE